MGSRLSILLWPLRMTGRLALGGLRRLVPDLRDPAAPAHQPPPSAVPPGMAGTAPVPGDPKAAYIQPQSNDGAQASSLTISQLEVRERLQRQDSLVMLDVREPHEVDQGHIPGAIAMPLGKLVSRFKELDPGHTIVAYCATGVRSVDAARQLRELGFARVHSLAGGFARWVRDGGAVARSGQEPR